MNIEPKAIAGDIPVYCSHDEIVDIMKVIPNPKNPNTHGERQIEILSQVIKAQGWRKPITVSKRSGFVVAGHGRLQAALMLKTDKVPVDYQDYATEAEEYADLVADNRIAELSEIDNDLLSSLLEEIKEYEDFDFELTGYTECELDSILEDIDGVNFGDDTEVFEDDYEVILPEEPKAKLGDIYQLGNHRLMCGDSTKLEDIEKLIDGNRIELLMTDPPYNMEYNGAGFLKENTKKVKSRIEKIIDFNPETISFLANMDIGSIYIFTSKDIIKDYLNIFSEWNFNLLTWLKTNTPPMINNNFFHDIEYILYFHKGNRTWNNGLNPIEIYKKYYISSIEQGKKDGGADYHPTMKPIKLISDKIKISSSESSDNGIVLDLFGGSGTTLIACEQLNRSCYMMEIEPMYIDVIIDRWEQFTGEKAVLLNAA